MAPVDHVCLKKLAQFLPGELHLRRTRPTICYLIAHIVSPPPPLHPNHHRHLCVTLEPFLHPSHTWHRSFLLQKRTWLSALSRRVTTRSFYSHLLRHQKHTTSFISVMIPQTLLPGEALSCTSSPHTCLLSPNSHPNGVFVGWSNLEVTISAPPSGPTQASLVSYRTI